MTPRISMRLTVTVLGAMWLLAAVWYFVNPLGTPSYDPRLRLLGFTSFRMPSASMEPTIHLIPFSSSPRGSTEMLIRLRAMWLSFSGHEIRRSFLRSELLRQEVQLLRLSRE